VFKAGKNRKKGKLMKTKIPKCPICKKPMVNAYDKKLKKKSKYIWKTNCGHNKNLRLCVG